MSSDSDLRAVKTMKTIICKTGESTNSLKQYYNTKHWKILTLNYMESELPNLCYLCKKSNIPSHFHHRTKKRMGKEKLTDIMPVCETCNFLDRRPNKSKKQAERRQLALFGFNEKYFSDDQKNWLKSINSQSRGIILSKFFSQRARKYRPSQKWINSQVKKVCRWIRKNQKEVIRVMAETV